MFPGGKFTFDTELSKSINLLKCRNCGLLYKNLIPSEKTLSQMYDISRENNEHTRWEYTTGNKYILRKARMIEKISGEKKLHVMDIGCHTGGFLKLMQELGFRTSGLDVSDLAYAKHKDFINTKYYAGLLEDVELPENTFDVVTAWDVFEHFYDVEVSLQKIYHSLSPGGYLLIETGNISSFPARLGSPNNWWYVSLLEHFNFFDTRSIRYILDNMNFGLTTMDMTYHKSMDTLGVVRGTVMLLKSLVFYTSPNLCRYLAGLGNRSGAAARLPWRDHILVVARKL